MVIGTDGSLKHVNGNGGEISVDIVGLYAEGTLRASKILGPSDVACMETIPPQPTLGYRQKNGWDGDSLMANKLLRNSEYYPDYLFAKINYAQVCLYTGDTDKIPEIFDGKFDLSLIYPERTHYHVSEFTRSQAPAWECGF